MPIYSNAIALTLYTLIDFVFSPRLNIAFWNFSCLDSNFLIVMYVL